MPDRKRRRFIGMLKDRMRRWREREIMCEVEVILLLRKDEVVKYLRTATRSRQKSLIISEVNR
jgi:hypothetical protein